MHIKPFMTQPLVSLSILQSAIHPIALNILRLASVVRTRCEVRLGYKREVCYGERILLDRRERTPKVDDLPAAGNDGLVFCPTSHFGNIHLKHSRSELGRYVDVRPPSGAFVVDAVTCDCMGCIADDVVEDYHFGSAGSEMAEKSDDVSHP